MTAGASALPALLRFSEADLRANRQGRLSEAQAARLHQARRRASLLAALLFCALVIVASLLLYSGQARGKPLLSMTGSLLIVVNALLSGFAGRSWMRTGSDLRAGAVEALAGDVERVLRRGPAGDRYLLRINGDSLAVSRDVFLGFQHAAPYRIYRSSHSRQLLSAEPA